MNRPEDIEATFNTAEADIQRYIVALEAENAKLHKQIARLVAENVSIQHRAEALEKALKEEAKKHGVKLNITFTGEKPPGSNAAPV